ncbi:MAG: protein phosphatase 2C domain-containing protein [Acidimicrobiia bacterium]|nr:protein phosphatase 2C domain-containing protein [Acidimicrobiia bacterium]
MIAVADGLGGCPYGDDAAQVAVNALPERIATVAETTAAFDAANAAAKLGRRIRALRSGQGY